LDKADKKSSPGAAVFQRLRRIPDIDKVLDGWDYGLMLAVKLRKPKPRRNT
jgi:hypothetical protein